MILLNDDVYLPHTAQIKSRKQESPSIFSVDISFVNPTQQQNFSFHPGQFNMFYMYGVGAVAISISSDPMEQRYFTHTIRVIGRVTKAMQQLKEGDYVGVRGPYGKGWPLQESIGKDIVIITGGLGCAPIVSAINYIVARRKNYGSLKILQGVKHSEDFIFRSQYKKWQEVPDTEVYIAADKAGPHWPFNTGYVTDIVQQLRIHPDKTIAMLCGPQGMMAAATAALIKQGLSEEMIYLSMERNMECGIGQCGHCQYGGLFICKDGPIISYNRVRDLFSEAGF